MSTFRHGLLAAVLLCFSVATLQAADPTYTIKLVRPFKKGDVFDTTIIIDQGSITKTGTGLPVGEPEEDSLTVELSGRVTVDTVDAQGEPAAFSIKITKLLSGKDSKEYIPAGKVLDINRSAKTVEMKMHDGSPIPLDAEKVLAEIYQPTHDSHAGDDVIFGSKTPKSVGESWPINGQALARDIMGDAASTFDPKNITGEAALKSIEKTPQGDATRIQGNFTGKDIQMPMPEPLKFQSSSIKAQFSGLYPVDTTASKLEIQLSMEMSFKAASPDGAISMESNSHMFRKETITPVK